jgi:two-component system, OmpR family, response regulator
LIRKKLLILDDNAPFSELLCDLLTQQGFDARWATGADDARAAAESAPPDVLIIDVNLGTCSGLHVAQQFWTLKLAAAVVFLTGKIDFDMNQVPTELKGIAEVLHKPVDKETLLETIAKLTPAAAAKQVL